MSWNKQAWAGKIEKSILIALEKGHDKEKHDDEGWKKHGTLGKH